MTYTVLWLAWGGLFVLIEGAALMSKTPGATLSEHVWAWFRVKNRKHPPIVIGLRVVLVVFLGWLVAHLAFGWWPK